MAVCDPWATEADLIECGCDDSLLDPDRVASAIDAASEWLDIETSHRFGVCTYTERPCRRCGCSLPGFCGCDGESILELTYGPIVGTPTVTIDGAAFSSFTVLTPNMLVRTDDEAWPSCQSLTSGRGTVVTYDAGVPVSDLARLAAADLAIEILKACAGRTCSLPAGTTTLNRRGVTVTLDPESAGRSLPRVAMLLGAYPRADVGLMRVDRPRGLITSGPA